MVPSVAVAKPINREIGPRFSWRHSWPTAANLDRCPSYFNYRVIDQNFILSRFSNSIYYYNLEAELVAYQVKINQIL